MNILTKLSSRQQGARLFPLKVFLVLLVLGVVSYAKAVGHPFVHDDFAAIKYNTQLSAWNDLSSIFFPSKQQTIINSYYRPLLEIISKIQYRIFALDPHGYHLFNIIVHIINSFLVYFLAFLLSKRTLFSLGVSVFFLIHPVQSESVAAIAGVSNLSFGFFLLTSLILYLLAAQKDFLKKNIFVYAASLLFFGLSLLSKEQAVMLPAVIILYELCLTDTKSVRIRMLRVSGVLTLMLGYLALRKMIVGNDISFMLMHKEELYLRILSVPKVLVTYVRLLLVPFDLHYYRCINVLEPYVKYAILLGLITAAIITVLRKVPHPYRRRLIFALGWFVVTLLPTLNIIPMVQEYSFIWVAEHFLYLPIFGFLFFVFTLADYAFNNLWKTKVSIIAAGLLLGYCAALTAVTVRQNAHWRGEIPLFERAVQYEGRLARLRILLARAYYFDKQYDRAVKEYRTAMEILEGYLDKVGSGPARQYYLGLIKGAHFDLAHCYEAVDDFNSAILEYKNALLIDTQDSVIYNNIGAAYMRLNKIEEAKGSFESALMFDPRNILAMNNLAICFLREGNLYKAKYFFEEALKISPGFGPAQAGLAGLLKRDHAR